MENDKSEENARRNDCQSEENDEKDEGEEAGLVGISPKYEAACTLLADFFDPTGHSRQVDLDVCKVLFEDLVLLQHAYRPHVNSEVAEVFQLVIIAFLHCLDPGNGLPAVFGQEEGLIEVIAQQVVAYWVTQSE